MECSRVCHPTHCRLRNMRGPRVLQRNVSMFLGRVAIALGGQGGECCDQARSRVPRFDHIVDIPARSGHVWIRELRRSEEHTSELQSPYDLVCRLLLEKKNKLLKPIQH